MEDRISSLTFFHPEEPTIVLIVSVREGRAQMVVTKSSLRRPIIVP